MVKTNKSEKLAHTTGAHNWPKIGVKDSEMLFKDPWRFLELWQATVGLPQIKSTHPQAHMHTPASSIAALGWSISRSVFILPCSFAAARCRDLCVN